MLYFLLFWLVYSLISFILGILYTFRFKNAYGVTYFFFPLGVFVWADSVIIGLFWIVVSTILILTRSYQLFPIFLSLFWLVRSAGETIYWLNQQFSTKTLDPPSTLFLSKYFPGTSVWFIYQIFHQCLAVISALTLIILLKQYFQ